MSPVVISSAMAPQPANNSEEDKESPKLHRKRKNRNTAFALTDLRVVQENNY
jgi:hypothetical protein